MLIIPKQPKVGKDAREMAAIEKRVERARQDGKFEAYLEMAYHAQQNALCPNCGTRSLKVPF